ncbi:hypothetical protein EG827_08455 [bacterium]|nr:hypothetical protein [bacterium]
MKIISLYILLLLHPVHVSLTGIEYDGMNRVYSVFVKVYSDDLEADMNLGMSSGGVIEGSVTEKYRRYITDRVMIMEDGRLLEMTLIDTESDGLEHRFSLKADGGRRVRNVTVVNRIMTRLHDDQANMLLFSFNGLEDGYRFTASDTLKIYRVK